MYTFCKYTLALALIGILAWGCKQDTASTVAPAKTKLEPTKAQATKAATKKAAAMTPDTMINKMKNCPNAVAGSNTTFDVTDKAVAVHVKATDAKAIEDIRKRAKLVAKNVSNSLAKSTASADHNGKGAGGGAKGKCPSVVPGATITASDIEGGATITLTPRGATSIEDIKVAITARMSALMAAGKTK